MTIWTSPCGRMTLHLGRWQDVLGHVTEVDSVITDPPYSERTHRGSNAAVAISVDGAYRQVIAYKPWTSADVKAFVSVWYVRSRGWIVGLTDDVLSPAWRSAYASAGRYDFAPVPVLQHKPRLSGDGPSSSCVWCLVGRPRDRRFLGWGSLPGWYLSTPEKTLGVMGAKPLRVTQRIVRDYSRPGDLIVDPYAGSGTTLLAAAIEGRRCIGAEMDPDTFALAVKRLSKGYTPNMFTGEKPPRMEQVDLFEDES